MQYTTLITMKKKYHTVGSVPKSNRKIVERSKMDTGITLNTQLHGHSLSWLGTGISKRNGGYKLVLWAQTLVN